jgi:hypothetical protein
MISNQVKIFMIRSVMIIGINLSKIKKDTERIEHDVKKGAEYAGHDVKKGAEYSENEIKKGAKSVFNKLKKPF